MSSPFLESVRADLRLRGYSIRTEKSYLGWIKRYIFFIGKRHPEDAGAPEVKAFLSWLANERHVAINTQKVALNALVFLYQKFLGKELGHLGFSHATKQRQLPTVLHPVEVNRMSLTIRHSFATQMLASGADIRTVQELLGRNADIHARPWKSLCWGN